VTVPRQRPWGALAAAVGSVLVVVGASVAVFVFHVERTAVPTPDAARWFAGEATWATSVGLDDEPLATTSLVGARGLDAAGVLPLPMEVLVRSEAADHPGSQVWTAITAARYPNGASLNVPEVYLASDEGITQLVGFATVVLPVSFEPPITVLPDEVEAGRTWAQKGTANYGSLKLYDYEVESSITGIDDDGCVAVRTSTTYAATEDAQGFGGTDYDETVDATVCPGRWITGYTSSQGTTRAVSAATARRVLAGYEPAAVAGVPAQKNRRRSLLTDRDAGSVGGADTLVVPGAEAVIDADIATNTVRGLVWSRDLPLPLWQLVGEGPTVVAPVRSGTTVVLADTHGLVTAIDATSGFVLWQTRVGRLPQSVALDADGLYVAVLDRSGSAELLTVADGGNVTSVEAVDDPVGVAVATDDEGPLMVVADASSVRGYRADGDETFSVDATPTAGPVVAGEMAFVGTYDGLVLSLDAEGQRDERYLGVLEVLDLVAGADVLALLDDDDRFRLLDLDDLSTVADVEDDGRAVTLGQAEGADTFTTTALDGRITTYSAEGAELRTVQAPMRSESGRTDVEAVQRAAAVSWEGVVWASAVTGLVRWEVP
jgi:outer membrane protein assembly factor BamB